jgi:5-methylcytosine-specific restriction endonuclease McrA
LSKWRHVEEERFKKRIYFQKNKKARSEYRKRYKDTEKGRLVIRLNNIKRSKRIEQVSDGTVVYKLVLLIKENQNNKCVFCNTILEKYHIDHILPLSRGGLHTIGNIQILCESCNLRKSNRTDEEFILYLKQHDMFESKIVK